MMHMYIHTLLLLTIAIVSLTATNAVKLSENKWHAHDHVKALQFDYVPLYIDR